MDSKKYMMGRFCKCLSAEIGALKAGGRGVRTEQG